MSQSMVKSRVARVSITGATGLLALVVYAAEVRSSRGAEYQFTFGGAGENQGVEILNYRYGNSKMAFTSPADWELAKGHIAQGGGAYAHFKVDTPLYVKWRVLSTGKEYSDTVDLKGRLPSDMSNKNLHFTIQTTQLNVYVIEKHGHKPEGPDCPVRTYFDHGCTRIYPDYWANF